MIRSTLRSLIAGAALLAGLAQAEPPQPNAAAELRAKHEEYRHALARNDFGKPVHLLSTEDARNNKGEVYGVVEMPFPIVEAAFARAAQWCDVEPRCAARTLGQARWRRRGRVDARGAVRVA